MPQAEVERDPDGPLDPEGLGRGRPPGLHFTPAQRRAIANRLMVQPPTDPSDGRELDRYLRTRDRLENGLAPDVLFVLESILLLAEQGNVVAQALYVDECDRFGITHAKRFGFAPR